jgi:MraZ protein
MFFQGSFEHTIDAKGRTSVPARFREVLTVGGYGEELVATESFEPCLLVHPRRVWKDLAERLEKRITEEPGVNEINRILVATAADVVVDKLGRILLPPTLRKYAALEKDVVWVGSRDKMELWSTKGWEEAKAEARSKLHSADVARVLREVRG